MVTKVKHITRVQSFKIQERGPSGQVYLVHGKMVQEKRSHIFGKGEKMGTIFFFFFFVLSKCEYKSNMFKENLKSRFVNMNTSLKHLTLPFKI